MFLLLLHCSACLPGSCLMRLTNLFPLFFLFSLSLLQAKDLQLGMILVCVVCMFFVTNVPRVLLNLYELFHVDRSIECGDDFR